MAALLALVSASAFGAADFLGGWSTRRWNSPLGVVVTSQGLGFILVAALLPWMGGEGATLVDVGWGAGAGAAGSLGLVAFYRGLAMGRMSVVAPVSALVAAMLPVGFGLLVRGERPSAVAILGIGICLVAVVLIGAPDGGWRRARRQAGLVEAVIAGVGFGGFFILYSNSGAGSGLWPLLGARLASVALVAPAAALRVSLRPARGARLGVVATGILDTLGNAFLLLALRRGFISLVAVVASMFPAVTILLARVVLAERVGRVQAVGLVSAALGVSLIALG